MKVTAIVPAAGLSKRMGRPSKLFLEVGGVPILALTLRNLSKSPAISSIVLAVRREEKKSALGLVERYGFGKVIRVVIGGKTRTDSVRSAVAALDGNAKFVLIHDAARPLVDEALISRVLLAARKYGAAVSGVPIKPTIKRTDRAGFVLETLNREELWEAQTPQVFRKDLLLEAMRNGLKNATDDSALVEALGEKVRVVPGSYKNIKITTPEDLIFAEALANE